MAGVLDTEERRAQVWEMLVRGVSQKVIADTLSVHRNTVANDIRVLRAKHRKEVTDIDTKAELGDAVKKFDEIFKYAMSEYSLSNKEQQRATFLEKAMMALTKKVGLLVDTGVLPKAANEITGKLTIEGIDVTRASLEELKTLRGRMANQLQVLQGGRN